MADSGIKKAKVLNQDLPIINSDIHGYAVRYRIVSDDKNRISAWSPTYYINADYTYVKGAISSPSKVGDVLIVTWDEVKVKKGDQSVGTIRDYEVWVKWDKNDGGDWLYYKKVQGNSNNFRIPATYTIGGVEQNSAPNRFSLEVYLEGVPVVRSTGPLLQYTITNHTV